jgi:hypothetical protein
MSNEDTGDLIRVEDFDSIDLSISINNLTSKTGYSDGKKVIGGFSQSMESSDEFYVNLVQLNEDGFLLDMPTGSCAINHQLNVIFTTSGLVEEKSFEFATEVKAAYKQDNFRSSVKLELLDGNPMDQWNEFLEVYSSRQNEINNFLKAAKG